VDVSDQILTSRVNSFALDKTNYYLPLLPSSFTKLFGILNGNLRDALGKANAYCQCIADQELPKDEHEKTEAFLKWLDNECKEIYEASKKSIKRATWEFFDKLVEAKGITSPSEYESFGYNDMAGMRYHIRLLQEEVSLVTSTIDESDARRKTIQLTAQGWLVAMARGKVSI
jgi:hypothetical protein